MPAKDVQTYPIAAETWVFRCRTWERLKFEIEYGLQRGTTANSYLITGDKVALFDPPGESFTEIFLEALTQRLDLTTLDYIVLGHVNANRSVTLKALLSLAPQATILCANPSAQNLEKLLMDCEYQVAVQKGNDSLTLGQGHVLTFTPTPNPCYPGQLCTFDAKTQILFSDKLFGAHVCGEQVFDEGWSVYQQDRRYFFDCVLAPAAKQIEQALSKVTESPAKIYAPNHGPLVRYSLQELTRQYEDWLAQQQAQSLAVTLIYASAYGNTATLAQAIARGITKAGVRVIAINAEMSQPAEIKEAITQSAGFVFGSPTLGGHAPTSIQSAPGITLANATKTQLCGVFGSFGWSGEAIDLLEGKLRDIGFQFGFETIRVKFKPTAQTLQLCEEAGTDFAQALKKTAKRRQRKSTASDSESARLSQALGRIVGSLSIVTTRQADVSSAMLASWVSQATFSPPGLTVAVAKDRAIESLLYQDSSFVLNILPEGDHLGLMKHFLKPFTPGADRFENVETEEAANGAPILSKALAFLECRVQNRMECGDHWLIYATTERGQVLQSGVTAVHYRKSGDHY